MICVGVDIGSRAVKAVAIKKVGKTFNILQTHFFPLKENGDLAEQAHLKTLATLYNSPETKYIFCVPQNEVSVETLNFPFKEKYKIIKSLPYQLEEKLSLFENNNLISDVKMTRFAEGKRAVLVFSVFKSCIARILDTLKTAGIEPFILTCEASAVSNLFENTAVAKTPAKKEDCHVYLKIGHTHTTALVFSAGDLQNVCSFEWGAEDCVKKISQKYEISFSKAMEQFREKAFVLTQKRGYTGSQIEFSKIVQEGFERLIDKLRLFLLGLEGEKIYKCKKIFICGGGAQVRNLQTLLSVHLNIPVSRVEKPAGFPKWNLRTNEEKQNNLITALGAAMEGLKKPKSPPINFLKEEFAVKFNPFNLMAGRFKKVLLPVTTALILLFAYSAVKHYQSTKLAQKASNIFEKQSMRTAKLRPKQISIERVQKFINSKKRFTKQAQLTTVVSRIPSALDKIKELSTAVKKQPAWGLEIQELRITNDKTQIQGEIARAYLPNLKKNLTDISTDKEVQVLTEKQIQAPKEKTPKPAGPALDGQKSEKPLQKLDKVFFNYSFIQKQG